MISTGLVTTYQSREQTECGMTYKLTYFNAQGVAEPIRLLLKYGNIDFEDFRIEYENWGEFKDDAPFGQVPIFEKDGERVTQSIAIARYLGKKVKLVGNDDWENLEIDAIVDTLYDMRMKVANIFLENDPEKKATYREEVVNQILPYYNKKFTEIIEKNNGYLALGRLTWADFYFAGILYCLNMVADINIIGGYPKLESLEERVNKLPGVKEWIEKRPKTQY